MVLTIKPDVTIQEFDSTDAAFSYIIGYNERHWKVNRIVYLIFGYISSGSGLETIPEKLEQENNIVISDEELQFIINEVFVKNGLLEGTQLQIEKKRDKGMWLRITVIPAKAVEKFSFLKVMFKRYIFAFCGLITAFFILFFNFHYINDQSLAALTGTEIYGWLQVLLFMMISSIIHEFGHASALMSGGESPGRIGAGFYMIMPVFFADVHNGWNLPRMKRVVVDLGGVYFQGMFLVICWAVNELVLHMSVLDYCIIFSCIQIIGNFNPFLKMDGYWILSDSLGISNLYDTIWDITLGRLFQRTPKHQIPMKIVLILYAYLVCVTVFICYYAYNYLHLAAKAFTTVFSHIDVVIGGEVSWADLSAENVMHYINENFTVWLVCIFTVIFAFRLTRSAVIKLKKGAV